MTDARLSSESMDVASNRADPDAKLTSESLDVASHRTAPEALLSSESVDIASARMDPEARLVAIGVDVARPVPWVRSLADNVTMVQQKHDDGVWRPFMLLGSQPPTPA